MPGPCLCMAKALPLNANPSPHPRMWWYFYFTRLLLNELAFGLKWAYVISKWELSIFCNQIPSVFTKVHSPRVWLFYLQKERFFFLWFTTDTPNFCSDDFRVLFWFMLRLCLWRDVNCISDMVKKYRNDMGTILNTGTWGNMLSYLSKLHM